ncbi:hypothetical protein PT974_11363 [Cladobotryum mycophilum]|uniref:Sulfatase N-terminal domain-containing protein n=1 Tax=Cladobotryum mycophilum TaxID=491253 RepID=A0ABR0S510_9HYPO
MYPSLVSFAFAVFFISVTSTKILHLALNAPDIPTAVFLFCLPAFFVVDVFLIAGVWLLLRRKNVSWLSFLGFAAGFSICIITLGAASSQWGFFYQTGGEVRWGDAKAFANKENAKVLLSESRSALGSGSAIITVAWIAKTVIYKLVGAFVTAAEIQATKALKLVATRLGRKFPTKINTATKEESDNALLAVEEYGSVDSDTEDDDQWGDGGLSKTESTFRLNAFLWWLLITTGTLALFLVIVAFDPDRPYGEMLTTLPLPLLALFKSKPIECTWSKSAWPLPELIDRSKWEYPHGDFKGWAPGSDNDMVRKYRERIPEWLPIPAPSGFVRWDEQERLKVAGNETIEVSETSVPANETIKAEATGGANNDCPAVEEEPFYNPVSDPLRITNLDTDFLAPIQQALKDGSIKVKHVALIKLESTREELFPLQQGSDIYKFIMNSHEAADREKINELLSRMTPNAEKLTGKPGNFRSLNGTTYPPATEWNDPAQQGFGGINVVGALTPSSVSTKSLMTSHCGAWPLPIDMFEEADLQSYQPCLPQILNMFNQLNLNESTDDFRNHEWYPAFFASVVDDYDRQHKFEDKIGFKHYVNKKVIDEDALRDDDVEEINYFGYPETALVQHVKDYIGNITANNQRMFFSHFTSTTHHPWATPKWFKKVDYMGSANGASYSHAQFNDYLNTIHFVDTWLGKLMSIFEEAGIANETLIVFVGDHGQAFREDFKKTGTYENGHVSNYRVPLSFRHPHLPRMQYEANATSMSILPTILDLLINTDSLNKKDTIAASDLIQDYEGQSLIRPYKASHNGRRAWNYGLVNPGGRMLTITSADAPWRLVMPIGEKAEYVFTDLKNDPLELQRLSKWSIQSLVHAVHHDFGEEAAQWLEEAEALALWWSKSRKRLWRYKPK